MDSQGNNSNTSTVICPQNYSYVEVFFLYVGGIGSITIIGLVLNGINMAVLNRLKGPVSLFMLRILAFGDIVFLLTCLVHFVARHLYAFVVLGTGIFERDDREIMPLWYWYTLPPYFMSLQNRNWTIVFITLERLISISKPLWARVHITKSKIVRVLVANAVMSICVQMPQFFDRRMATSTYKCADEGEVVYLKLDWGFKHDRYGYVILVVTVPLLSLYIMNIALIYFLRKATKARKKMTYSKEETNNSQANMMVLAMIIVFTICESPAALDRVAKLMGYKMSNTDPFFHYGRRIGLLLIVVDSAVNFLAYFASTRRFRQCLVSLWRTSRPTSREDSMTNISVVSSTL